MTYLAMWGLLALGFAIGYVIRGLWALRDIRELDELRRERSRWV